MKTIIFDLGGVIFNWQPQNLYRTLFPSDEAVNQFLQDINFNKNNAIADAGSWSDMAITLKKQHPQYAEAIQAYPDRYLETLTGVIEGTLHIVQELKQQNPPLYVISNWASDTFQVTREAYPFLDELFADICVSGDEGIIKPDPEIYQRALKRWSLKAEDCIFIDDSAKNIETANALGIDGILFTTPEALRSDLKQRGFKL